MCRRDLTLWRVQARSLARFWTGAPPDILVIVNEPGLAGWRLRRQLAAEAHLLGHLSGQLRVIRPRALGSRPTGGDGWRIQQALKLLSHRAARYEDIVLLDAKNLMLAPLGRSHFFDEAGRPRTLLRARRAEDAQLGWLRDSLSEAGLPVDLADRPAPPTITPYPVSRALLRACCARIESRFGPVAAHFATKQSASTEFFLIYAEILHRFGAVEAGCATDLSPPATLFRSMPRDAATMDLVLRRVESGSTPILSIHADRIGRLDPEAHARIVALLSGRGVLSSAEAARMLGPPRPGRDAAVLPLRPASR